MRELLITTGHNSSVILIEDGQVQWGYETERVTGVKSDSRFPLPHIENWGQSIGRIDLAHVTHWSPDGRLMSMKQKYWDPSQYLDGVPIHTLDPYNGRSHHDTHMHAAFRYANSLAWPFPTNDSYGVVIDGFGTLGEHFSVYKLDTGTPKLVHRVHGYDTSLGLWYQYATAFMGLKMHEDEYKLLGYEAHVDPSEWNIIQSLASRYAYEWLDRTACSIYGSEYDPLYSVDALPNVKDRIFQHLSTICKLLGIQDVHSFQGRATLACYVQTVLELVVTRLVAQFNPRNLVLSGGVFYNVKLNKVLMEMVDGQTCVYPLAGDQGNALGLYAMAHPEWQFPDSICWGKRVLRHVGTVEGLFVSDTEIHGLDYVAQQLRSVGYVNLVRGNMEFGPRALCNTSTLALPRQDIVHRINKMNDRNTVMPMAPVMTRDQYHMLFNRTEHVWNSEHHMIIAMPYAQTPSIDMMGIAHGYKEPAPYYTGRPQVIGEDDDFMQALLAEFGPLINTSFNYHGKPIALGMDSVVSNHLAEYRRDDTIRTVVIANA
jgi:predicted NodU family carbamoyl transferase